jgi:uncharacterized repeat protein (TIGR01451 family)
MVKRLSLFLTSCLAVLMASSPALASFHFMKIEQVIGGVSGNTSQQAIQLRMRFAGQNMVGTNQARLIARDAAGLNPVTILIFPTNVAISAQGSRILVASSAFAAAQSAIDEDFIMTNTIPASYLAAGRLTFEDSVGTIYWSLSWGGAAYTGSTLGSMTNDPDGNFGPSFGAALPSTGTQALRFSAPDATGAAASTTNLADYSVTAGAASFTNNAGGSGTVVPGATANLSITKTDSPDPVTAGMPLTYTLTVANAGPNAANAISVTDTLPSGTVFQTASGTGWTCSHASGTVTCTRSTLTPSTAPAISIMVTAPSVGGSISNTATVTATEPDPVPGDNSDTEATVVLAASSRLFPLPPCRIVDTRNPPGPTGGPALQANTTRTFPVAGECGVPLDAKAVAVIVTVAQQTQMGDLRIYPAGSLPPGASAINFAPGRTRANNTIVALGVGGAITVQCDMPPGIPGSTHFLLDIYGYFR